MKKFSEYLRAQAEERKRYENAPFIMPDRNRYDIIESIDESINDITFESIDNYIASSLSTSYFGASTEGYWKNIYETLILSHDAKKCIKHLEDYFGDDWLDSKITSDKDKASSFLIYLKCSQIINDINAYCQRYKNDKYANAKLPDRLVNIMNFFNYYFSSVTYHKTEDTCVILCEPKYSEKCNDLVYDDYNGILYHVTHNSKVDRILKRGLQVKGKDTSYRYIEPRINLFLANSDKEIKERANLIARQHGYQKDDFVILRIDLKYGERNSYNNSSYDVDFYHDTLYNEDWSVYTYGLIHPRFITKVDIK